MPYIITTRKHFRYSDSGVEGVQVESRHAVTTLDEARTYAFRQMVQHWPDKKVGEGPDLTNLPEAGGTVGPLPDETVIEVEYLNGVELGRRAGLTSSDHRSRWTLEAITDAYNEQSAPAREWLPSST